MKTIRSILVAAAVLTAALDTTARAVVSIGAPAPDFTVTDIEGKSHRLADYKGRTVVIEWVNPECPFVQKHYNSGSIPDLQRSATDEGVVWLAINSSRAGSEGDFSEAAAAAWLKNKHAAPTAYVRDVSGQVGRLYAAKTTPHLYVINGAGVLVYNGAIDSIRSADVDDIGRAENYVKSALAAVQAGQPVAKSSSQPYGCSVKY